MRRRGGGRYSRFVCCFRRGRGCGNCGSETVLNPFVLGFLGSPKERERQTRAKEYTWAERFNSLLSECRTANAVYPRDFVGTDLVEVCGLWTVLWA